MGLSISQFNISQNASCKMLLGIKFLWRNQVVNADYCSFFWKRYSPNQYIEVSKILMLETKFSLVLFSKLILPWNPSFAQCLFKIPQNQYSIGSMLGNPHQFDQHVCQKSLLQPTCLLLQSVSGHSCPFVSTSHPTPSLQSPFFFFFFFFLHFGLDHMDSWPRATIPTIMGQTYKSSCLSATGSSRTSEWLPPHPYLFRVQNRAGDPQETDIYTGRASLSISTCEHPGDVIQILLLGQQHQSHIPNMSSATGCIGSPLNLQVEVLIPTTSEYELI